MTQGIQIWCSVTTKRGGMGYEMEGRFKKEKTYVCPRLIHVHVRHKPTQYCEVIILQLKVKFKKN